MSDLSRNVRLNILGNNKDAIAKFDEVDKRADALEKRKPTVSIGIDTRDFDAKYKDVSARLDMLGKRNVTARVGLDTSDFDAKYKAVSAKLDILGKKKDVASVSVDNTKANKSIDDTNKRLSLYGKRHDKATIGIDGDEDVNTKLDRIMLKLDKFGKIHARATVGIDGFDRTMTEMHLLEDEVDKFKRKIDEIKISDILGKIGGSAGGKGSNILSGLLGGGGGEEAAGGAASGGGGLVGVAGTQGVGIAGKLGPAAAPLITGIAAEIATLLPALISGASALMVGMGGAVLTGMTKQGANLLKKFENIFDAIKQDAASVMLKPLEGVTNQLGHFIGALGPTLKDLFAASVPFVVDFVHWLELAAKIMLPALTESMRALAPVFPILLRGFTVIIEGLADMMKVFIPGLKGSSEAFVEFAYILKFGMIGLAVVCTAFAKIFQLSMDLVTFVMHLVAAVVKVSMDVIVATFKIGGDLITGHWGAAWDAIKVLGIQAVHILKDLLGPFWKWIPDAARDALGALKVAWDYTWSFLKTFTIATVNFIQNVSADFWHFLVRIFTALGNGITNIWHATWVFVKNEASGFANDVQGIAVGFWHFLVRVWNTLGSDITGIWHNTWTFLKNEASGFGDEIEGGVEAFWHAVSRFFTNMWHEVTSIWSTMWKDLANAAHNGINFLGGVLHRIISVFEAPISFIINHVWDPLANLWDKVVKTIGLSGLSLPAPHVNFAEGGVVPGPQGAGDIIPAMLSPGERVLSTSQVSMLGGHSNINAMVGGGGGNPSGHFATGSSGPLSGGSGGGALGGGGKSPIGGTGPALGNNPLPVVNFDTNPLSNLLHAGEAVTSELSKIAGMALGAVEKTVFGPILNAVTSHIPGADFVKPLLKKMTTDIIDKLASLLLNQAQADQSGLGSKGPEIVNFAKTFVGKVPYHLGGGADYAPYGKIRTPADANRYGGWDCAGFVGQMYGHFGIGPGTAGINVGKLERWGQKTKQPVVGGFATEAGDQSRTDPGHVVLIATPEMSIQAAHTGTDTIIAHDRGAWVQTYVPPGGASASNAVAGDTMQNGRDIYNYLKANLFGGNRVAAAGAIASIWGESGWNPESRGTGGNGLIGWTPPRSGIVTGNPTRDMRKQLPMIIQFVNQSGDEGVIHTMMQPHQSVAGTARLWGVGVERYGINDVHPQGIALAQQIAGLANGGIINEPIMGMGASGQQYLMGEAGPEAVIPLARLRSIIGGGSGDTFNIFPPDSAVNPEAYAKTMIQAIRDYKRHHGNQATGIG